VKRRPTPTDAWVPTATSHATQDEAEEGRKERRKTKEDEGRKEKDEVKKEEREGRRAAEVQLGWTCGCASACSTRLVS